MPIYEYACTSCGERTEAKQGFDDPPLEDCLNCGGKLRKLYSPVGIVFKGSGFYSTDQKGSKTAGKKTDGKTDETKTSETSTKPSSSSDSGSGSDKKPEKPAATSEKSA